MPSSSAYISPDQLCVGLYIQLELAWWEHNFAFSNFKIKDESQIKALRALGVERLRYDPARSDCEPLSKTEPQPPVASTPAPTPPTPEQQASQQIKTLNQTLRSRPEEACKQAGEVVGAMVDTLLGGSGAVLHTINSKAAEDNYLHSLNVTVLSLMLGRQLGLDSEDCHVLGMGALLHDVGKLEVPSKVLLKPEPLTRPEQQLLQLHCEFGLRMGHKLMLDDEVLRIINEHHEYCDGSGYPRQLREAAIGRLSRLVCITNQFDNLCNPLNPRDGLSPHEALALMFKQYTARFDAVALKAFIRCMGIYPPGCLVQLDDQRYGLVLGMNPSQPLKPTLIVYDPAVPKNEALIIDLEQEPRLSIAASLRPAQLPREALEYLNPRQQLSYFVEPSNK
ncbi:HD-GYP domain-containing protein [Pseudomonas sp.]|uniref:HD-GYP domain-containing protein n=1 Tax=Pseudomonas sp. TaxID=306 RepID=UPI004053C517